MSTDFNSASKVLNTPEKAAAFTMLIELRHNVKSSGRIEQVYMVIDRIVKMTKTIYPQSYCNSCSLTCCINDLFLPVSFMEWKAIEAYLDKKVSTEIKGRIAMNLGQLPDELYTDVKTGQEIRHKYMNKTCPLLIDNKCSIRPYRPVSCRTYGWFLKNTQSREVVSEKAPVKNRLKALIKTCSLELSRWENDIVDNSAEALYLAPLDEVEKIVSWLNIHKQRKLLIIWLKEYFESKNE